MHSTTCTGSTHSHARNTYKTATRSAGYKLPLMDLMFFARQQQDGLEALKAAGAPAHTLEARSKRLSKELTAELDRLVGKKYRKGLVLPHLMHVPNCTNYSHTYFVWAVMIAWMFESPRSARKLDLARYLCAEFISSPRLDLVAEGLPPMLSPFFLLLDEQLQPRVRFTHAREAMQLHVAALHIAKRELPQLQFVMLNEFEDNVHLVPVGIDEENIHQLADWIEDDDI